MTSFVIGVDGGGTRTRAVVLDEAGHEVGRAVGPGTVVREEQSHTAAEATAAVVRDAAWNAGVDLPVACLWAGLAGAGRLAARDAVRTELREAALARRVIVGTDVEAAFHDAFEGGPGVLLIAGTGSIAWARDVEGVVQRVGGWGAHLGDEGSGHWIGIEALGCVARAADGRADGTALEGPVLDALVLSTAEDLIPWVDEASKRDIAALVPIVADVAAQGDAAAEDVLERAVDALTVHVQAILDRAGPWPVPPSLVLWGGLIGESGGHLRERMLQRIAREDLGVTLSGETLDPPAGAARLALLAEAR